MIRHSWSPDMWIPHKNLKPLTGAFIFHLQTHGLTFACNVGLPGALKKDATAARQRALPWLGWYPLFWPEFTSVTSATASCYPAWVQQNLQGRHCMRNSSNHFSTGSKVRIAGWIALCQRYQCLWWVFLRRTFDDEKGWPGWLQHDTKQSKVFNWYCIHHVMVVGPPEKQKGSTGHKRWQLCGLSRNGIHDLSDGIPDVLGPFTQANAPFRWLLIFSLQTPLPGNDHGHPGNIQWPTVIMGPSGLNYTCITERLIKYSIYNMYIYIYHESHDRLYSLDTSCIYWLVDDDALPRHLGLILVSTTVMVPGIRQRGTFCQNRCNRCK